MKGEKVVNTESERFLGIYGQMYQELEEPFCVGEFVFLFDSKKVDGSWGIQILQGGLKGPTRTTLTIRNDRVSATYQIKDGETSWYFQVVEDLQLRTQEVLIQRNNDYKLTNPWQFRNATIAEVEELVESLSLSGGSREPDRAFVESMLGITKYEEVFSFEETLTSIRDLIYGAKSRGRQSERLIQEDLEKNGGLIWVTSPII